VQEVEMKFVWILFSLIFFFCCAYPVLAIENETRDLKIESFNNLQSRVLLLINARKIADINTLYSMTSRRYRERYSLEKATLVPFAPTVNLMACFIEAIRIDGDEAFVTVSELAMQALLRAPLLQRGLIQKWVKEDGTWNFDPQTEVDNSYPDICGYSKSDRSHSGICGYSKQPEAKTSNPCGR